MTSSYLQVLELSLYKVQISTWIKFPRWFLILLFVNMELIGLVMVSLEAFSLACMDPSVVSIPLPSLYLCLKWNFASRGEQDAEG
ncbi:hypothetical protein Tco_1012045 [Tanacetum coccineum]